MLYLSQKIIVAISLLVLTIYAQAGWNPENMKAKKKDVGWSIGFENDLLAGGARDKDFTYGVNVVHKGERSRDWVVNPDDLRSSLDRAFDMHRPRELQLRGNRFELGLYGFTPDDISQAAVIEGDRPYASLVYVASTHSSVDVAENTAESSTLTVGVLGLDVVADLQNELHQAVGGKQAQGWQHQISDGGELTARYSWSRHDLLPIDIAGFEAKSSYQFSLGYITEGSYNLGFRKGQINSRWWEFDPELTVYGENAHAVGKAVDENYFWAGLALKARAYNSFMQGQFRRSDHTYNSHELRHFLLEAWAGYTLSFANQYRVSYVLRTHSSELKEGVGDRSLVWGGLVVSRSFP